MSKSLITQSSFQTLLRRAMRLEARALQAQRAALLERWQIIRRSPRLAEALRYQLDLLPATLRQLAGDYRRRRVLMRALLRPSEPGVSRIKA